MKALHFPKQRIASAAIAKAARFSCVLAFPLLLACSPEPTPYTFTLPPDFPPPVVPADNPITEEKVSLGRFLFYDPQLSGNASQSCASCHKPELAFSDGLAQSIGSTGEHHSRNSLSLANVAYNETFTWAHDQLKTLERQILIPLFNEAPVEMGVTGHEALILARLENTQPYASMYSAAFPKSPNPITLEHTVQALASFVRALISFNSPFDRYAYYAEDDALSPAALRGMEIFMSEKTECRHCHGGFNFSQSTNQEGLALQERPFHDTGLYNPEKTPQDFDFGLFNVSQVESDKNRFRAPTLRNLRFTAPYMHDGSLQSLEDVVDFYMAGGRYIGEGKLRGNGMTSPNKSVLIRPFDLTDEEKQDLLAFLDALNDETFVNHPLYSNPWRQHTMTARPE